MDTRFGAGQSASLPKALPKGIVYGLGSGLSMQHNETHNGSLKVAGAGPYSAELDPGFDIFEPERLTTPLVFSSPHSGSLYPAEFLALTQLDAFTLRRSEDAFVDELFACAPKIGAPLIRAHFPRAFLDVNREPYELDQRMFEDKLPAYANTRSLRVAGGLGTIARVVGDAREIYGRRLPVSEALARIDALYKPWHVQLRRLMQRAEHRFGAAVLIDCHSMPSNAGRGARPEESVRADVVLGDRYGTSCDSQLVDAAEQGLRRLGYSVVRNKPYAGGFITEHYGNPSLGWHALQIELNRGLYMDEKKLERTEKFARLTADLTEVAQSIADVAAFGFYGKRAAAE